MRYHPSFKYSYWARYKKQIILAALALIAVFTLALGGIAYALYKTAVVSKSAFQSLELPNEIKIDPQLKTALLDKVELVNRGWMEGFVISLGTLWLQQNLAEQNTAQLKNGLSCLDAIGGPNPLEMVSIVKTKVDDIRVTKELDKLTQSLQYSDNANRGPAACANWILKG